MKKTTFTILALVAVGAGLTAAWAVAPWFHTHSDPGAIHAMWLDDYKSLGDMSARVDAVVVGTVETTRPGRVVTTRTGMDLPFTLADVRVERVIRGSVGDLVTVEQTGGDLEGRTLHIDGDGGLYARGERVLLFLKRQEDSGYYYIASPQARYEIVDNRVRAAAPDDAVARQLDLQELPEAVRILSRR